MKRRKPKGNKSPIDTSSHLEGKPPPPSHVQCHLWVAEGERSAVYFPTIGMGGGSTRPDLEAGPALDKTVFAKACPAFWLWGPQASPMIQHDSGWHQALAGNRQQKVGERTIRCVYAFVGLWNLPEFLFIVDSYLRKSCLENRNANLKKYILFIYF